MSANGTSMVDQNRNCYSQKILVPKLITEMKSIIIATYVSSLYLFIKLSVFYGNLRGTIKLWKNEIKAMGILELEWGDCTFIISYSSHQTN